MYKHRSCGADLPSIAAAFVHLATDCPFEERKPRRTERLDDLIGIPAPRREVIETRIVRR